MPTPSTFNVTPCDMAISYIIKNPNNDPLYNIGNYKSAEGIWNLDITTCYFLSKNI